MKEKIELRSAKQVEIAQQLKIKQLDNEVRLTAIKWINKVVVPAIDKHLLTDSTATYVTVDVSDSEFYKIHSKASEILRSNGYSVRDGEPNTWIVDWKSDPEGVSSYVMVHPFQLKNF